MRFESSPYTSSETNDYVINNESKNVQKKLLSQVSGINKVCGLDDSFSQNVIFPHTSLKNEPD